MTTVAGSSPPPASEGVSVDAHLAVQFSAPALGESLTPDALSLVGPDGPVTTRVIVAEGGRLAFVWPATRLRESSRYTLTISGARDQQGRAVVPSSVAFTTTAQPDLADAADLEEWVPDVATVSQGWRANRRPSSWESLAPLMARPGVTAVSGRT